MSNYDYDLIHAETQDYCSHVALRIGLKSEGKRYLLKHPKLAEINRGDYTEPTILMSYESAQRLLDELYRIGLRPRNGSSSIAHIEALENHLKDFRKIAFNKLKINDT